MGVRKSLVLFPVKPGSADTAKKGEAVRLIAQNREFGTWDSDGCLVGIYVNGRRQVEYDTAPEKNPKSAYQHFNGGEPPRE